MIPANELAAMLAVVTGSLDQPVTVQRITRTPDTYGHFTENVTVLGPYKVNILKPTAVQMQQYASIIGSQWALMLRFVDDIRENDIVIYGGRKWRVQNILNAESYTFANEALITIIV